MARRRSDILTRLEALEEQVKVLRQAQPPKVRFEMALRRTRARAQGVSPRQIARAAEAAVRAVREEASRKR